MEILLNGDIYDQRLGGSIADVNFYVRKATEIGGPVLELFCGTGRITIPIAKSGLDVTGVDLAESMLERARRKAAAEGVSVQWIHGDATSLDLGRKFRLILAPFNSLQLLHHEGQINSFLRTARAHLQEDGVLIFDVLNPNLDELAPKLANRVSGGEYRDPHTDELVTVEWGSDYDDSNQLNHATCYLSTSSRPNFATDHLTMRCYYPEELNLILRAAGFSVAEKLGEFDGRPFSRGCASQIVSARPA